MTILWEEYREVHPEGYGYSRFCDLLRGFERRLTPVMRQHHVAGEKAFVDYSGKRIGIADPTTGEIREAEIFRTARSAELEMDFSQFVASEAAGIAEGAVLERVKRDPAIAIDPHILHGGLIYEVVGRARLAEIHGGYARAAREAGLPILLFTDTWRCSRSRLEASAFRVQGVGTLRELEGDGGHGGRGAVFCKIEPHGGGPSSPRSRRRP